MSLADNEEYVAKVSEKVFNDQRVKWVEEKDWSIKSFFLKFDNY